MFVRREGERDICALLGFWGRILVPATAFSVVFKGFLRHSWSISFRELKKCNFTFPLFRGSGDQNKIFIKKKNGEEYWSRRSGSGKNIGSTCLIYRRANIIDLQQQKSVILAQLLAKPELVYITFFNSPVIYLSVIRVHVRMQNCISSSNIPKMPRNENIKNKLGLSCAKLRIVELKIGDRNEFHQNEFHQNEFHQNEFHQKEFHQNEFHQNEFQ